MATVPLATGWLVENGPKELEHLFRAVVFQPSVPLLLADNDRQSLDASVGASKLLGMPREQIIGRSLDDFADPSFKPVIEERWNAFLEAGEQEGTLHCQEGRGRRLRGKSSTSSRGTCCRRVIWWCCGMAPPKSVFRPGCRTTRCSCWMRTD